MGAERVMLMLPCNVVMMARIKGYVDPEMLQSTVEKLRVRHAFLAVRVRLAEDDSAVYDTRDVPALPVRSIVRTSDSQWLDVALEEYRTSFPIETGPLIRFILVHSQDLSELIICGHHAVCDGISLSFLIRDILSHLSASGREVEPQLPPPPINYQTAPPPPGWELLARFLFD